MNAPLKNEMDALAAAGGVDGATARLFQSVLKSGQHGAFIKEIDAIRGASASAAGPANLKLVIVPGAFYQQTPRSGADGHVVRAQAVRLGWPVESIPIGSTGSLASNARLICDWLSAQDDTRIVLVSISKGGSDLKMALREPDAEHAFRNVHGWINLCGILDGTPLVDWLRSWHFEAMVNRLYFRALGAKVDFVRELRRGPGEALDVDLQLPAQLRLISIVGFPQRAHMSNGMTRRCFDRMSVHGPNDGVIVLDDVCAQPGLLYPVWGADHLLRTGTDWQELLGAVLIYLAREIALDP
jgi:hypothetical protein